jgi:RNA recognition motif-containing protein
VHLCCSTSFDLLHTLRRGFGTVRFYTPEDAAAACAKMHNMQMDNRVLSVRIDRFQ